jgi:hypothetical protein
MDTLEHRLLERIDGRTETMQVELTDQRGRLRTSHDKLVDHEARIRALEDKEAVSRTDMRRMGILFTLVVLGALGAGTVIVRGQLDDQGSTVAAPSGKAVPIEVLP